MPIDPATSSEVAIFIGQHLVVALISVAAVVVQLQFPKETRRSEYLPWLATWVFFGLTHLGFSVSAWSAFEPGAIAPESRALSLGLGLLLYATLASVGIGLIAFIRSSVSRRTVLGFGLGGLVLLPLSDRLGPLSVPLSIAAVGCLAGGITALVSQPEGGGMGRWFAACLAAYALPLGLYAWCLDEGIGTGTRRSLFPLLLVGNLDIWISALFGINLGERGLAMRSVMSAQRVALQQAARDQLKASEERFRSLVDQVPAWLMMVDGANRLHLDLQRADLPGAASAGEVRAQSEEALRELVHPEDYEALLTALRDVRASVPLVTLEVRLRRRAGPFRLHECTLKNCLEIPTLNGIVITASDVADRRGLEERLAQAERLESTGRLAAGVAHDFNNLLTVIQGNAEFLTAELPPESPLLAWVDDIERAASRGGGLTRQLLAFVRKQVVEPRRLDLNELVAGFLPLILRLVPNNVEIVWTPGNFSGCVVADATHLEQILLNLTTNARDAMPQGGKLLFSTERNGDSLVLRAQDTGSGMSEEVLRRALEPFYTTKPVGFGTGLGLATCFGAIRQAGGSLEIESELGSGTSIVISLPRVADRAEGAASSDEAAPRPKGNRTLLLVEDLAPVREVSARTLRRAGYEVLVAGNGLEGLKVFNGRSDVAAVVTDIVMPELSGDLMAERLRAIAPSLPILFVSGYSDNLELASEALRGPNLLLRKPYRSAELLEAVRRLLGEELGSLGVNQPEL